MLGWPAVTPLHLLDAVAGRMEAYKASHALVQETLTQARCAAWPCANHTNGIEMHAMHWNVVLATSIACPCALSAPRVQSTVGWHKASREDK